MGDEKKRKLEIVEKITSTGTGETSSVPLVMFLRDPDLFLCSICTEPLSIPVFQCKKKWDCLVCSSCCDTLGYSCSSCSQCGCLKRCLIFEKIIKAIQVCCENKQYGCHETLSYDMKKEHEITCKFIPALGPSFECDFRGLPSHLYAHLAAQHSNFHVKSFKYNYYFSVEIEDDDDDGDTSFFVVHEQSDDQYVNLFIIVIHKRDSCFGDYYEVSVSRMLPYSSQSDSLFSFKIILYTENGCLTLESAVKSFQKRDYGQPYNEEDYLLIPSLFVSSLPFEDRKLNVRIWS